MSDTQKRGHCQCCGREQAVKDGHMAHHGYTVPDGYFINTCEGQRFAPVEHKRETADGVIESLRTMAKRCDKTAAKYRAGTQLPETVLMATKWVRDPGTHKSRAVEERVPYAEAPAFKQRYEVERIVRDFERQARANRDFADMLEGVVRDFHGKPLRLVTKADKPAPINPGDRRKCYGNAVTCTSVDRGRVWFTYDEGGRRAWIGVQGWRKLEAP